MSTVFYIQLLMSFLVGGALVALQSWVSEKVPEKISGIILSMPSTIIVNMLFLAMILSKKEFALILPMIPAPLGFSFVFIVTYIYAARWLTKYVLKKAYYEFNRKILVMILSFAIALPVWFLPTFFLIKNKMDNILYSWIIYVFCIIFAQWVLRLKKSEPDTGVIHYTFVQILIRAVFSGAIIATTIFLGKTQGPLVGGAMTMFPAAYLSALIILHYYYNYKKLFSLFDNAALGSTSILLYVYVAHYSFPVCGYWFGTVIAIILCMIFSLLLGKGMKTKHRPS